MSNAVGGSLQIATGVGDMVQFNLPSEPQLVADKLTPDLNVRLQKTLWLYIILAWDRRAVPCMVSVWIAHRPRVETSRLSMLILAFSLQEPP